MFLKWLIDWLIGWLVEQAESQSCERSSAAVWRVAGTAGTLSGRHVTAHCLPDHARDDSRVPQGAAVPCRANIVASRHEKHVQSYRYAHPPTLLAHPNHNPTTTSVWRHSFPDNLRVSRHQKGKPFWILMKQEMMGGSGISRSMQTANHASTSPPSFYRPDALPAAQPTGSKHWRQP